MGELGQKNAGNIAEALYPIFAPMAWKRFGSILGDLTYTARLFAFLGLSCLQQAAELWCISPHWAVLFCGTADIALRSRRFGFAMPQLETRT
jgi:hypothetical protein